MIANKVCTISWLLTWANYIVLVYNTVLIRKKCSFFLFYSNHLMGILLGIEINQTTRYTAYNFALNSTLASIKFIYTSTEMQSLNGWQTCGEIIVAISYFFFFDRHNTLFLHMRKNRNKTKIQNKILFRKK